MILRILLLAAAGLGLGCSGPGSGVDSAQSSTTDLDVPWVQSLQSWRREREARLRSEDGWLTVAGFFWLEPGASAFGSDSANPIALPEGSSPRRAGTLTLTVEGDSSRVVLRAEPGAEVMVGGAPVTERVLMTSADADPEVVEVGRVRFWIIHRGGRLAVRVRDPESPLRRGFRGIESYPINPGYRVRGRLRARTTPTEILLPNVLGYADTVLSPGPVKFKLLGQDLSLLPVVSEPTDSTFFFVFRDETSGGETYGGGRFLYADLQPDGAVMLDFNRAYNPPCAFNPHTTCPLPPEGNDLPVAVRAGERAYAHD